VFPFAGSKKNISMKSFVQTILKTIVILFFAAFPAYGQDDFRVIKVNGTIMLKQRGVSLETGTVFAAGEDLLFRTEDATAAVINSKRGRLVITSNNHDLSSASSNYLPPMYNISSRGGSMSTIADLSSHFSGRYAVLGKTGITVDRASFPLDKDHFFFLRYAYKGEVINKKLESDDNTFYIDKAALYTVDGSPIPGPDNTSIRIYYRRGNESLFINEFNLIFPDTKLLEKETEIILNEIKEKTKDEKTAEVGAYITDFYGKIERDNLSAWLEKRFGIR